MALDVAIGSFQWTTAAATNTIAETGLGFQPKALILWCQGLNSGTDATSSNTDMRGGLGFCAGTTDRVSCSYTDMDFDTNSTCKMGLRTDAALHTTDNAAALDGALDLSSFDASGFTMVIDTAIAAAIYVHYIAFGGDDLTNATTFQEASPGATGTNATTGIGFQPDVLFTTIYQSTTAPNNHAGSASWGFGVATGSASAENQIIACSARDNQANADTGSYCQSGECVATTQAFGTGVFDRAILSSFDADGFTLNWLESTAAIQWGGLCMKGGQWKAGNFTSSTTATTTIPVTGAGFAPDGVMTISCGTPESTNDTEDDEARFSIGAGLSTTDRLGMGYFSDDATARAEVSLCAEYDAVSAHMGDSGSLSGLVDINSMDSDGITFIQDDGDPLAAWVGYVMFASDATAGGLLGVNRIGEGGLIARGGGMVGQGGGLIG
jgi:hypothetical protein